MTFHYLNLFLCYLMIPVIYVFGFYMLQKILYQNMVLILSIFHYKILLVVSYQKNGGITAQPRNPPDAELAPFERSIRLRVE